MKNIKHNIDFKSLMIGFLLSTCMFLLMGQQTYSAMSNNDKPFLVKVLSLPPVELKKDIGIIIKDFPTNDRIKVEIKK